MLEPKHVTDRLCGCAAAVPSSDPREPVLFLRCGNLADAEALAANVDGSWSPKIAAVLRTSLGGAPPTTGLSPLLLFTRAATAWMRKHCCSACEAHGQEGMRPPATPWRSLAGRVRGRD
jgi:hypothetical protein